MIIVDTKVLVSGVITNNPIAPTVRLLDDMVSGRVRALSCAALLDEYRAVLLRPKIRSLHHLSEAQIDELLVRIVQHAMWREPPQSESDAPDSGDNHLWDLLHAEPAAILVTGDLCLLHTPPFETRVIRVQDYDSHTTETQMCPPLLATRKPQSNASIQANRERATRNDAWIAALARDNDAGLCTRDRHFDPTENIGVHRG